MPSPTQSEMSEEGDLERNESSTTEKDAEKANHEQTVESTPSAKPPYCALSSRRRAFVLTIVTVAGFFGPLAGNIYLPALPVLQRAFGVGETAMNATVSSFMVVFAFAVCDWRISHGSNSDLLSVASHLDQLLRLQRSSAAVHHFSGDLHRSQYLDCSTASKFRGARFSAHPTSFWVSRSGVNGRRNRSRCTMSSPARFQPATNDDHQTTEPKNRGKAMSYFLLGPQLGPVLGPVIGGALAEASWRWIFGFLGKLRDETFLQQN